MRSGGCSIHQSLTPEAASIVKQAITLAKRRGHAQVTPIHVASVMLASPAGLLRAACLKSHSHPLQCKALELCFNVALNRLPTTSPSTPMLGGPLHSHHPHHYPTLANALMAAFKRAQAHQRRGSIETQQQPILALKIEVEQLVVSILDDPSVSRVMREAGFSSTHVKSNVDQVVSLEGTCSQISTSNTTNIVVSHPLVNNIRSNYSNQTLSNLNHARNEDVSSVIESWMKRREKSSVVLVGECLATCEGVVRGVKEKVERGDIDVPLELRYVQFLNCPLLSMKNLSREEIDLKLGEIRCLLKGCGSRGAVLYLGDLRWVAEYWAYYGDHQQRRHYYCPVEHLVMGLRRLVFGNFENGRLWLMGIATFNSYIKCKSGNPSLDTLLDLHPLTIPAGSLDLSLNLDSCLEPQNKSNESRDGMMRWTLLENKIEMQLTCCTDCSANCRQEARSLAGSIRNSESITTTTTTASTTTSSTLPSWLRKCRVDSGELTTNDQEIVQIKELCKKWNLICGSAHKPSKFQEKTINFSSCSPSSSTSISSYDHCNPNLQETKPSWPIIFEPKWATKEHQFLTSNNAKDFFENHEPKPELLSNPNSTPNSASSSEATEAIFESPSLLEFNPENLEIICSALEKKVPWQKDIIPEIATTILRCRAGLMSRKSKQETWLFFLGFDEDGKLKVARELAKLIFGSHKSFKSIALSNFSLTRADSTDDYRNKRARDELGHGYLERFAESIRENPHRVFYLEDVEQIDHYSQKGIKRAIDSGKITLSDGESIDLEDAIVIFSCESFSSASRACSPPIKQKIEEEIDQETEDFEEASSSCVPLDLNIAIDHHDHDNNGIDHSVGDINILESVDKLIVFKLQVL